MTVASTNDGAGSFIGNPSGEMNFIFPAFQGYVITATTCSPNTAIETYLRLYDGCPSDPGTQLLAEQSADFACSYLQYQFRDVGTYWIR